MVNVCYGEDAITWSLHYKITSCMEQIQLLTPCHGTRGVQTVKSVDMSLRNSSVTWYVVAVPTC